MLKKNKYLTKEEKSKRNLRIAIAASAVILIWMILLYQLIVIPRVRNDTKEATIAAIYGKGKYVYVLKKAIKRGDAVNSDNFKLVYSNGFSTPANAVRDLSKVQNEVARINLSKNTPISTDMFINMNEYVTEDLRDVDYSDILLNKDLKAGQFVDIIYRKKDGTNFTVVSKIKVNNVAGQTLYTSMTAEQRQYKDNATVKASLTGGTILTVRYTDAENQQAAKVTYPLDKEVEKMINADPKAVKRAGQALKERNKGKVINKKPDFANSGKNK